MKKLLAMPFLFFSLSHPFCQNHFVITCSTNYVSNGAAVMIHDAPPQLFLQKKDTVKVANHRFVFDDTLAYPVQFRILIIGEDGKSFISEPFFVDAGNQKLTMDSTTKINWTFDFGYGLSLEGSVTNDEYIRRYLPLFDSVNKRTDAYFSAMDNCKTIKNDSSKRACRLNLIRERDHNREIRDNILIQYAAEYPGSPILPWILCEYLKQFGYKERYQATFDLIAEHLPPRVKESLKAFLNALRNNIAGNLFPLGRFFDTTFVRKYIQNNKYTLIEFWFSGCLPCIAQFNSLKDIYLKYRTKGLEIIAISIDGKKDIKQYKRVLRLNNYPWKQVLDTAGLKASSLNIFAYPTSYLLDMRGKIISENLTTTQLDALLREKL